MATHSSILAWRISWTKEAGGLQSMGLQRVRHDCVTFTHSLTQKFKFRSSVQFSRSVVSDSLRPHEFKDTTKTGGEGNGNPLQYSCLENPMDGKAWWAAVHGVSQSQIRLSDFTFTFHFHALEKEMATHSSVLTWRIPGTREPGGLPSMGLHRVGHD